MATTTREFDLTSAPSALPPGPAKGAFWQGQQMQQRPFEFLRECGEKFGDAVTLTFPGQPRAVWVNHPDMVRDIFRLKADDFDASQQAFPQDVGKNIVLFLNGEKHKHARSILIPPFQNENLRGRADMMQEAMSEIIDGWKPGDKVDLYRTMGAATLTIITKALFGYEDRETIDRFIKRIRDWVDSATRPSLVLANVAFGTNKVRNWLNAKYTDAYRSGKYSEGNPGALTPWNNTARVKARLAHAIVSEIRKAREINDPAAPHFLNALSLATYDDGSLLEEEHIIDEAIGFYIAGHETSAATSAWYLTWLVMRDDVREKVRAEIRESVATEGGFVPLEIDKLPYLRASLSESQRLCPSAVGTSRTLTRDARIGTLDIPAGTTVLPNFVVLHRRKDVWGDDADEFRPERWLDGSRHPPHEFAPFGGGRRACVGASHARQQMRILIAEMFRRCEFAPVEESWPRSHMGGGAQAIPINGVPVIVKATDLQ